MFSADFSKKRELYLKNLQKIDNLSFTSREIDVISCIIHNRGEKKIADILSISHRTVGSHMRNIMSKLGCGSKEHIIDFIDKSGKLYFFKEYYYYLLTEKAVYDTLLKISKLSIDRKIYYIFYKNISSNEKKILEHIRHSFKYINIDLYDIQDHNESYDFYIINNDNYHDRKHNSYGILIDDQFNKLTIQHQEYFDFRQSEFFYHTFYQLLKTAIFKHRVEQIINEFNERCIVLQTNFDIKSHNFEYNNKKPTNNISSFWIYMLLASSISYVLQYINTLN